MPYPPFDMTWLLPWTPDLALYCHRWNVPAAHPVQYIRQAIIACGQLLMQG